MMTEPVKAVCKECGTETKPQPHMPDREYCPKCEMNVNSDFGVELI